MVERASVVAAEEEAEQSFDAADPESVNKVKKQAGRRRKLRLEFVAKIMADREGRRWVHDILRQSEVFRTSFCERDASPLSIAFREGKRYIGLLLLGDVMKAAPATYTLMVQEAEERKDSPLAPPSGV